MKKDISSLELYYFMKELQILVDSKVDRVYHSKESPQELIIGFHVTSVGKKFLIINLPGIIYFDETKDEKDIPTGLCMMLRKYLEGGRLKSIKQKEFERAIEMEIQTKAETFRLIIELFSKGNIIFCSNDYTILNVLEEQEWKDRKIKRKELYVFPISQANVPKLTEKDFISRLTDSGKESIVKALAISMSLGGTYAEELCTTSGVKHDSGILSVTSKEYSSLYKNFLGLFNRDINANLSLSAIYPFVIKSSPPEKSYASFNDAIRENHESLKDFKDGVKSKQARDKIQKVIDEQSKLLEETEQSYQDNQSKAEAIYSNYQLIDEILKTIKSARKKYPLKEIKQKIKDDPRYGKIIKEITDTEIILEVEK